MQDSEYNELLKTGLRRKLTAEEEGRLRAHLAAHPEDQPAWEEEMALNNLLRNLPKAPLSSNFTAQVLQLVEKERRHSSPARSVQWWHGFFSLRWTRQVAFSTVVLFAGLISYHQFQVSRREAVANSVANIFSMLEPVLQPGEPTGRVETTRTAAQVSDGTALPTLEMLENFDAIKRLNQVPPQVDVDLLAALQ
jgi:anti-sigma factor RsiW